MSDAKNIALLLADVDGTLVTHDKLLTERAIAAVKAARQDGIQFALTSGRPPRGMKMLFDPLDIQTPIAGFNGGAVVDRALNPLLERTLPPEAAATIIAQLREHGLDVWVYTAQDWVVENKDAPHVQRESWTVKFEPVVVQDVASKLEGVVKIVGVTDDEGLMQKAEQQAQDGFGDNATVACSQPYYLDITHKDANKGGVVAYLMKTLHLEESQIATIGDQPNDVSMFRHSGISIAMGNAKDAVKQKATETTDDSEHEGFAKAVEHLLAQRRQ